MIWFRGNSSLRATMLNSTISRIFCQHADAERSAASGTPTPDQKTPDQPEQAPAKEVPARSTLGENWPPNLHSHETDWVVIPEAEPTPDAERPMM
jgi:hypothetical protein